MSGFRFISILSFFVLCLAQNTWAQWREPRLIHLGPEQGLSSWIFDITQDSTGYIYFGTDQGLVRYDGNTFELFAHIPDDSTSIGPGDVWCVITGSDGLLWIGTRLSGLNVFNPKTDKFKRYATPAHQEGDYDAVRAIYEDDEKQLWVGGTHYELYKFDTESESFQTFRPSWISDPVQKNTGIITQILQDRDSPHMLWLSITEHYPEFKGPLSSGLVSFNKQTGEFSAYPCWGRPKYQDNKGSVWLAADGVNRFDIASETCQNIPIEIDIAGQKKSLKVRDVAPYDDRLIVTSYLSILSMAPSGDFRILAQDKALGIVEEIFRDRQNNLWFGRNNGVTVLSAQEELIRFYALKEFGVTDRIYPGRLAYDADQHVLFVVDHSGSSTQRKIIRIPLETGTPSEIYMHSDYISGIAVDDGGKCWINSGRGIQSISLDTENPAPVKHPLACMNKVPSAWNLQYTASGWIGGVGSDTLFWFNPNNGECHYIRQRDYVSVDAREAVLGFHGMSFLKNERVIAFSNNIFDIDLRTESVTVLKMEKGINPYPEMELNSVIEDQQGHIWVASLAMTAEFERNGDSLKLIKKYTVNDGMGSAWVHELYPDESGRIWAFAQNGLNAIDPSRGEIRQFGVKEGLADPYVDPRQVLTLRDGSMATVNGNGVIVFHPDSLWNGYTPLNTHVVLKEIRSGGESIVFDNNVNTISRLELKPYQDNIDIQFQGLAFPTDYNLTYSYKVEGLNHEWISIGENKIVTLSSLSPGSYTLKIKAGAASSPAPEKVLTIFLATPLPQKPWFIILSTLVVLSILYLIYRWRIRRIRQQEEEKLIVSRQMAELELKALRSQMNPHFMFNSLNSIKNYILRAEPKLAAEYLSNFSHLIRMILQNSGEKEISLQDELETLILYIELEQIRFEKKFEFNCVVEDGLPLDSVRIPPMILQPYIENAIWHGLMHKEGTGHLLLSFSSMENGIRCTIDDDGIGRTQSAALKRDQNARYKSMGMGITKDRIDILNKMNALGIDVEIIDKKDISGHAMGTQVVVSIPGPSFETI